MLQYGWYFGNSKDFGGVKIWRMSIYVHLCCSMGDMFDNLKDFGGVKIWRMSIYVHLCCSMGDVVIIQRILVGWQVEECPFMSIYAAVWVIFW